MTELCDTCGCADSNSIPCYLMFREGTNIQSCGAYIKDVKKHAKLAPKAEKADTKEGGK